MAAKQRLELVVAGVCDASDRMERRLELDRVDHISHELIVDRNHRLDWIPAELPKCQISVELKELNDSIGTRLHPLQDRCYELHHDIVEAALNRDEDSGRSSFDLQGAIDSICEWHSEIPEVFTHPLNDGPLICHSRNLSRSAGISRRRGNGKHAEGDDVLDNPRTSGSVRSSLHCVLHCRLRQLTARLSRHIEAPG